MQASFSPDGRRVLTAGDDKAARVWDAETGQPVTGPLRHDHFIWQGSFSPDGRRVLTASHDTTARVWDAATGQPVTPPMQHAGSPVYGASFSPDGRRVVTAGQDGTARVWDAATGQPVSPPLLHEDGVMQASFSADGRRVLTLSQQGKARVWEVASAEGSVEDLLLLSRLLSGQRIDASGTATAADVGEAKWQNLRRSFPDTFAARPVRPWHEREADYCLKEKYWTAAVFHLDALLAQTPGDAALRRRRGTALLEVGRVAEAAADFTQSLALQPDDPTAYKDLGDAHARLGRLAEAAADFEKAIALAPRDAETYYRRGGAEARQNQYARSAADFVRAAELAPDRVRYLACQALALRAARDEAGCRRACATLLERFGERDDSAPTAALVCVASPATMPDWRPLLARAEKQAAASPQEVGHRVTLGAVLYRMGRFEAAARALHAAGDVDKDDTAAAPCLFLAMAYHRLGKPQDARGWFDEADRRLKAPPAPKRPEQELPAWAERLALELLRKEAEALLGVKP
jgi:tetratricopeptide (TPR) repeat protein